MDCLKVGFEEETLNLISKKIVWVDEERVGGLLQYIDIPVCDVKVVLGFYLLDPYLKIKAKKDKLDEIYELLSTLTGTYNQKIHDALSNIKITVDEITYKIHTTYNRGMEISLSTSESVEENETITRQLGKISFSRSGFKYEFNAFVPVGLSSVELPIPDINNPSNIKGVEKSHSLVFVDTLFSVEVRENDIHAIAIFEASSRKGLKDISYLFGIEENIELSDEMLEKISKLVKDKILRPFLLKSRIVSKTFGPFIDEFHSAIMEIAKEFGVNNDTAD